MSKSTKNVLTVILTVDATGLKRFQQHPTFKPLLHENQRAALQVGDNTLSVNHTVWGKLQQAAGWDREHISVRKQEVQ